MANDSVPRPVATSRLPVAFFARATVEVARDLLGRLLVRQDAAGRRVGRIVEVEAYLDGRDLASHARFGPTPRTAPMFGPPGHAYVYAIYGMHHCFNVVTEADGIAGAVLIRALEPLEGLAAMRERRGVIEATLLTSGPARLCQAFSISRELSGCPLDRDELHLAPGAPLPRGRIVATPRIGVDYAGRHANRRLRFVERDSRFASRRARNG
jgi:DNA-3-methyladenine glycosylase